MQQFRPTGFKLLPDVVKNILIINGLLFLATIAVSSTFHTDLTDKLGLHYLGSEKFQPYQLITYMFMHGGFSHILYNMFALWMFGNILENVWGPKRFLIYYLFTGLGAAVVHYVIVYFQMIPVQDAVNTFLAHPNHAALNDFLLSPNFKIGSNEMLNNFNTFKDNYNSIIKTDQGAALTASVNYITQYRIDLLNAPVIIGASGAVFGILLAFGMMFPNSLIYVFFAIPVKAKWFVMFYGALELYSGISNNPNDNVAHFAHLGGMLFGIILLLFWRHQNKQKQFR